MARYEEIADTRPRIRRDVLYTRTPTGVLFHNAHGGFSLTTKNAYRFASLLVPHLDGGHSVADLCSGLGDQQRAMITQLVAALYGRGFARDAGPAPEADAEAVSPRSPPASAPSWSTSTTTWAAPPSGSPATGVPGSPSWATTSSRAGVR